MYYTRGLNVQYLPGKPEFPTDFILNEKFLRTALAQDGSPLQLHHMVGELVDFTQVMADQQGGQAKFPVEGQDSVL